MKQQKIIFTIEDSGMSKIDQINAFLEKGWRVVSITAGRMGGDNSLIAKACAYVLIEKP